MRILITAMIPKRERIKRLESLLDKEDQAFFNGKRPSMPDPQYDSLRYELKGLDPNNPRFKKVGATPKEGKRKLPFPMPSLEEVRPNRTRFEDWREARGHKGDYVLSDKLDGSSLLIAYKKGHAPQAYSRGNGTIGREVTHLLPHLNVPQRLPQDVVVRGELVMGKAVYKAQYKDKARNARALVNGLVTRSAKNLEGGPIRDSRFVAYELLSPRMKHLESLRYMKTLGFTVVPYKALPHNRITSELLAKLFEKRKAKSQYELDGLVVTEDKKHPVPTTNPGHSRKFKVDSKGVETTVVGVQWNPSRYGLLIPRVQIRPVELSEATVTWVTGHNAAMIYTRGIGKGAKILVTRSGDVIPYILDVLKPVKPEMPPKGSYEWDENKVHIKVKSSGRASNTHKQEIEARHLENFFVTLGVEELGLSTVYKLQEIGLNTIQKIIKAPVRKFETMEGFGKVSAKTLYTNIQSAIRQVDLPLLMYASGFFGRGLGETRIRAILEEYPQIIRKKPTRDTLEGLLSVPSISHTTAKQFLSGLGPFVRWGLKVFPSVLRKPLKSTPKRGKLKGKIFVFTLFRDKAMERAIIQKGGKVSGSVSRFVTAVITDNPTGTSGKLLKARELKVPILSPRQFYSKWLK